MAFIRKRGNKYSVVVYQDGKPHWISGFSSWTAANLAKHEYEQAKDSGTFIKPSKLTLGKFLISWLEDTVKPNLAPKTYDGYRLDVEVHIIPSLGKITLSKLTTSAIQEFYADKRKKSAQTAIHCFNCLRAALNVAIKQHVLIHNPCTGVITSEPDKKEMQTLDEEQVHQFLEEAKPTLWYELFYTVLYTGMRRSELLGLKWSDVNLDLCELSVKRSRHVIKHEEFIREPKRGSQRLIDLTPSNSAVLRTLLEKQTANSLLSGVKVNGDTWVFCDEYGKGLLPDSASQAWRRMARRLKLPVSFHEGRHTHASLLLKQGVPAKVVQERLGHKKFSTTMDIYVHVMPGIQQKAAEDFDRMLNR